MRMRTPDGMRNLARPDSTHSHAAARGMASPFGSPALLQTAPVAERWIEHGGLVWMKPDRVLRSWHGAHELSCNYVDGIAGWRLPSSDELMRLFHFGLHEDHGWPLDFYWSQTRGANRSHHLVSSIDACEYVHGNDDDLFHVTLVRRLQAIEWTLVD